jgi:hypothetical protein
VASRWTGSAVVLGEHEYTTDFGGGMMAAGFPAVPTAPRGYVVRWFSSYALRSRLSAVASSERKPGCLDKLTEVNLERHCKFSQTG